MQGIQVQSLSEAVSNPDVLEAVAYNEAHSNPEELAHELRQLGCHLYEDDIGESIMAFFAAGLEADKAASFGATTSTLPTRCVMPVIEEEGLHDHLSTRPNPFPADLVYQGGGTFGTDRSAQVGEFFTLDSLKSPSPDPQDLTRPRGRSTMC